MAELGLSALKSARRDNTDRVMDHRHPQESRRCMVPGKTVDI